MIVLQRPSSMLKNMDFQIINKCDMLLTDENTRWEVSTKKRYKRPSIRVYKNNKVL